MSTSMVSIIVAISLACSPSLAVSTAPPQTTYWGSINGQWLLEIIPPRIAVLRADQDSRLTVIRNLHRPGALVFVHRAIDKSETTYATSDGPLRSITEDWEEVSSFLAGVDTAFSSSMAKALITNDGTRIILVEWEYPMSLEHPRVLHIYTASGRRLASYALRDILPMDRHVFEAQIQLDDLKRQLRVTYGNAIGVIDLETGIVVMGFTN